MTPINEEVTVKQEILEVSLSSFSGSSPALNSGSSGKKRKHAGAEKRTAAAKTPKTAPIPSSPSFQPSILPNKLTVAQKDALRLASTGHTSAPSLASRNVWAAANNLKREAVHRYCRYLRDRSKQDSVKQEPDTESHVEAVWHLGLNSADEKDTRAENREAPATPTPQIGVPKSHQPDLSTNLGPSMAYRLRAVCASEPSPDSKSYLTTLQTAPESLQVPDFSFLSDARFFDLLAGPDGITYDDLHDPITFCMKFQDSYCSLDMEVVHKALRTMYFFEGGIAG